MENIVHGLLVCCSNVLEAERHHEVLEDAHSSWNPECSFVYVFWCHENLIVPYIPVHEAYNLVPGCRVDQCLRNGHWVLILWCCPVKVSKVDANPPSAVLLLDWYHAGYPLRVSTWPDESILQHFFNFFFDLL